MLNEDCKDMLLALVDEKVEYLLVGAYALASHGYPRATMDIDIWVMPSPDNADAVLRAARHFGAPLRHLTKIEGTTVRIPSIADLIRNKRSSGRARDIAGAEALEELAGSEPSAPGDA